MQRFQGSFIAERRLSDKLVLAAELSFYNQSFDYLLDNDDENVIFTAEITDFSVISYNEIQNLLRLPVSVYYEFTGTAFRPYLRVGLSPGLLLTAGGESTRSYIRTDITFEPLEAANVDLMPGRRMFNLWGYLGGGFNYKIGPGNFFLDIRYYANILDQVKPGFKSFSFQELSWSQYLVSDRFLLNNYGISAGYMFPIYRPKKKEDSGLKLLHDS